MTTERDRSRDHVTTVFPTEYVRTREVHFSRALTVESSGHVVTAGMAP
jgi:hypothetical protein